MSAYGPIKTPNQSSTLLLPLTYLLPSPPPLPSTPPPISPTSPNSERSFSFTLSPVEAEKVAMGLRMRSVECMTLFNVTKKDIGKDGISYLTKVFNQVVKEGRTYPQKEVLSEEEFSNYFFSANCFISLSDTIPSPLTRETFPTTGLEREIYHTLEDVKGNRSWEESLIGFFYIKPNYPGRSNHNCNGGFVVPDLWRGRGVGKSLGKGYLVYAPLLGYKASVFNLVYVNNVASVKIWDSLGFNRIGLVPQAGLLKNRLNGGTGAEGEVELEDEFVDAWVYHKTF